MDKKIQLGDEVRDTVTGFKGVAVARTKWLAGCDRINIQPKGVDKNGKLFETQSFDEPLVEVIKPKKSKSKKDINKTGGPRMTITK